MQLQYQELFALRRANWQFPTQLFLVALDRRQRYRVYFDHVVSSIHPETPMRPRQLPNEFDI